MSKHVVNQQGFSAVELLITLFVAVAFLVAGYQLYFVVIKDSGNTRAQARATNTAYNFLRQYSATVTAPCSPGNPLNNSPQTVSGLTNVQVSVAITCPYSASSGTNSAVNISRVDVTVAYNSGQSLKYTTFAHDTPNAGASSDITSGLIDWWKFNGNAQASIGEDLSLFNTPTLTTGQNGQLNGAYIFNGSNQYGTLTSKPITSSSSNFTISAWVKRARNASGDEEIISEWAQSIAGQQQFYFGFENSNMRFSDTWTPVTVAGAGTTGSWIFVVGVNDSTNNNAYLYMNGALAATKGSRLTFVNPATNLFLGRQGEYSGGAEYIAANIDDVRIYNRALSSTEVTTLYNNGAQ